MVVLLVVTANYPVDMTQPSMPLHPWLMANKNNVPHLQTFFANSPTQNPSISQVSQLYSSEIASARGWSGTRCLPKSVYELRPGKFDFCNLEDYTMPNPLPALSEAGILEVKASENISCSCDSGEILCPQGSIVEPPRHLLPSTDYLMNLTHYNVSNFLLKTRNEAILKRYGGLNFLVSDNPEKIVATKEFLSNRTRLEALLNSTLSSPELTSIGTKLGSFLSDSLPPTHYARIWYHNKGYPSSTAYLNVFHNLQLRMFLAKNNIYPDPENYGLAIANFPLPTGQGQATRVLLNSLSIELTKAIGVIVALSFVSSSFASFIIREKHSGAMAMQFLSGHSRLIYWSMSYVWDFISFLIPIAFIIIIFVIFDEQAYIGKGQIGAFIVLLVVYGLAITPLMYCLVFIFRVPSLAFVSFLALNILVSLTTAILVHTLELTSLDNPDVSSAAEVLANLFLIFPQFAFSRGFYELAKGYAVKKFGLDQLIENNNLFSWKPLTEKLVAMTIEAVVFSGILLLVEYSRLWNVCGKFKNKGSSVEHGLGISADVMEERERVENVCYVYRHITVCLSAYFMLSYLPNNIVNTNSMKSDTFLYLKLN
uniref:ABC transporter domain-containing protein n=1 Tax=Mesocestoides corti TaxID=53468 RepID=A0A5K3G2V6_MESCO